jgi:hypothetical protein
MLLILCGSLDNIFFASVNRLCVPNSVLSDENGTDDKKKHRTDNVACTNHSPWDVVAAYEQ